MSARKASYDILLILFQTAKMATLAVEVTRPFKLGHVCRKRSILHHESKDT